TESRLPPLTAATYSSSTGSSTQTAAPRPVGAFHLGSLTELNGSSGRYGGSGPRRRIREEDLESGGSSDEGRSDGRWPQSERTIHGSQDPPRPPRPTGPPFQVTPPGFPGTRQVEPLQSASRFRVARPGRLPIRVARCGSSERDWRDRSVA